MPAAWRVQGQEALRLPHPSPHPCSCTDSLGRHSHTAETPSFCLAAAGVCRHHLPPTAARLRSRPPAPTPLAHHVEPHRNCRCRCFFVRLARATSMPARSSCGTCDGLLSPCLPCRPRSGAWPGLGAEAQRAHGGQPVGVHRWWALCGAVVTRAELLFCGCAAVLRAGREGGGDGDVQGSTNLPIAGSAASARWSGSRPHTRIPHL